jgi:hypothetical protein
MMNIDSPALTAGTVMNNIDSLALAAVMMNIRFPSPIYRYSSEQHKTTLALAAVMMNIDSPALTTGTVMNNIDSLALAALW